MSTVMVLSSPEAGRGRAEGAASRVLETIEAEGREAVDITGADAASSRARVADAVAGACARLVVVGGDGLVHLALQEVAGTSTVLGVVPFGTGNDFARAFGCDESASVEYLTRRALGPARSIDAIRAGDSWVASVATAGFSGDVNGRANRLRWPKGSSRYTAATLLEIPRLRHRHVGLVVDGKRHELQVTLLAVANTAWFGGGMQICPDADPVDGQLDVTVVRDIGRLALLRYFPKVFSGRHLTHPKTSTYRGRRVTLECEGLAVWGDGEPFGSTPVTFSAEPDAIRLAI